MPSSIQLGKHPPSRPQPVLPDAEAGYMLVAVIVMVALVLIALSVAAPSVAKQLRREKEIESQHRAEQYVRAIRLYYRKTHAYPPSIDALKSTNDVRFLRQEYADPLTGKSDWKLIHLGEQKTTIKGFFGQELGGIASTGLGSAVGSSLGTPIGGSSSTSTVGSTSPLTSGFKDATITTSSGGTGAFGSSGATGSTGSSGGGAIIGVGSAATGNSISAPNQQGTYETWEFWYDPRIEQLYQKGHTNAGIGGSGIQSPSGTGLGTSIGGQQNGAGSSTSNSPFSSSPSSTTSPGSSTTPQP